MSQQQMQQKAGQAKEQSQAFSVTIYNTSLEIFDAATSVVYFLVGAIYGAGSGLISLAYNPKVQGEVKEAVNGAKQDITDGAYDIKARWVAGSLRLYRYVMSVSCNVVLWARRVADSTGPALNDAKAKASDASKQAQSTASDLSKQGQAKANHVTKQAQGTASDLSKQGQDKASDFTKQAQGTAADLSRQGQGKANDVKNQAASQGKQVQGQFKQTAQANGVKY